jgi:hypothetical protein
MSQRLEEACGKKEAVMAEINKITSNNPDNEKITNRLTQCLQ